MTDSPLLVVGAGYTGKRLLARLEPDAAVAVSRRAPQGVNQRVITADLDHDTVELPEAQSIIYTVPPSREAPPDDRLQRLLDGINVLPKRIVYFSTSGVYGNRDGALIDETAALRPTTARSRRRVASEDTLAKWCDGHDVTLCILRVPGIYGPGRLRLQKLRQGEPVLQDGDAPPANRIHVDDLVTCALHASDPDRPAGIYNVGDGNYRSSSWFVRTVAELAGLPPPPEVPLAVAQEEFGKRRLSFLGESRRLDVRRMRDVLGVKLAYADALDGIKASLND